MNESCLQIEGLHFDYEGAEVIKGISFNVKSREIIGILGPNASGKTTLLKNIAGLLRPRSGQVLIQGRNVIHHSQRELSRAIAFVPQEEESFLPFSAEQVVLMGRAPYLSTWGFEGEKDRIKAREAMEATRIVPLRERSLHDLSGGERQRVILARALAQDSPILLLDEPTSHLDIRYQTEIMELCADLNRQKNITLVITLHDINLASLYCHRLLLLKEGAVIAQGTPEEVITEKNLREAFGAEVAVGLHKESGLPYYLPVRKDQ